MENLDHFGPGQIILDHFYTLGFFRPFGPFWTVWTILDRLDYFGPFGPFWTVWTISHKERGLPIFTPCFLSQCISRACLVGHSFSQMLQGNFRFIWRSICPNIFGLVQNLFCQILHCNCPGPSLVQCSSIFAFNLSPRRTSVGVIELSGTSL